MLQLYKKVITFLVEDDRVEALLGLCGSHIQVLFGSFSCTVLIQSCEGLIAWVEYDLKKVQNASLPQN